MIIATDSLKDKIIIRPEDYEKLKKSLGDYYMKHRYIKDRTARKKIK